MEATAALVAATAEALLPAAGKRCARRGVAAAAAAGRAAGGAAGGRGWRCGRRGCGRRQERRCGGEIVSEGGRATDGCHLELRTAVERGAWEAGAAGAGALVVVREDGRVGAGGEQRLAELRPAVDHGAGETRAAACLLWRMWRRLRWAGWGRRCLGCLPPWSAMHGMLIREGDHIQ